MTNVAFGLPDTSIQGAEPVSTLCSAEVLRRHAKSFHFAALFLSKAVRRDVQTLYAFCRYVDDLVDEAKDPVQARTRLDALEVELLKESPQDPLLSSFRELAVRCGFGFMPAIDLIAGMRSDLVSVRIRSAREFELYCYRVAGTVGIMMMGVLGVKDGRAIHYAVSLGMAMQVTNICRDVLEDAARDRVYLPGSELERRGLNSESLLVQIRGGRVAAPEVRALANTVQSLLWRAEDLYRFASEGFRFIPFRSRIGVAVASTLYRAIGRKLMKREASNPLRGRVTVTFVEKLWLGLGATLGQVGATLRRRGRALEVSPLRPLRGVSDGSERYFFSRGHCR